MRRVPGRLLGVLEQKLCDWNLIWRNLVNNDSSLRTFCIPTSSLSSALPVRCWDAPDLWLRFTKIVVFSLQVEYSRSGSRMWASQRAASNFTEIRNLLVSAQYTVRVSQYPLQSPAQP